MPPLDPSSKNASLAADSSTNLDQQRSGSKYVPPHLRNSSRNSGGGSGPPSSGGGGGRGGGG